MALLAATILVSQALSAPAGSHHSDADLEKRANRVAYAGINIAGCEFGIDINVSKVTFMQMPDDAKSQQGNSASPTCPSSEGPTQMQHFAKDDGLNLFRLPVGWQYLVNNNLGGSLDAGFFGTYDNIMQACLATGAYCILDLHNYARWNGGIIGQGGPTNNQFSSLWTQLAQKYASQEKVIFGLMNEPHGIVMSEWAATLQQAVTAVRTAGATSQMILLSGTNYDAVGGFTTNSAPMLAGIVDSDGSQSKLIYEAHQYLDGNGGQDTNCVTDGVADQLAPMTTWLRSVGRKAMLTETGGSNTASCETDVCAELSHLNDNSDVWLGWAGWAAGITIFFSLLPLLTSPILSFPFLFLFSLVFFRFRVVY